MNAEQGSTLFHLYAWVFPAFGANYMYFGRALVIYLANMM